MKKYFSFLFLVISTAVMVNAQTRIKSTIEYSGFFDTYYWRGPWSFTGGASVPLYTGDFCDELECNPLNPGFLLGAGYKIWPHVYFVGEIHAFTLATENTMRQEYNSFKSNVYGLKLYGRYYLREDIIRRQPHIFDDPKFFKPYFFLGLNPLYISTSYNTLEQEDVDNENALTLAIPAGVGFSLDFSRRFSILLEVHANYVLTDELDGLAVGEGNDAFLMAELKVQYSPWAKKLKRRKTVKFKGAASDTPADGTGGGVSQPDSTQQDNIQEEPKPESEENLEPAPEEETVPLEEEPVETTPDDEWGYEQEGNDWEETPDEETPAEEPAEEESTEDDWGDGW